MPSSEKFNRTKPVLFFFFTATFLSWIFRVYQPEWLLFLKLPYGFGLNMLVGFGPLISAIVSQKLLPEKISFQKLSFFGSSAILSLAFAAAPVLVLILTGIKNNDQIDIHLFGFKTSIFWLFYIFGEEYGWRGYLQQLIPGNTIAKILITGILWYFWHLSFLFESYDLAKEILFMIVLIAGSAIAFFVTRLTGSLLTAIALHFAFSVMTNIPVTPNYKFAIAIMLAVWTLILIFWNKKSLPKTDQTTGI